MRCPACNHVRTRLDPLPDTRCPECGIAYARSLHNVQLGLLQPATEKTPRTSAIGIKAAALILAPLLLITGAWYLLLAPTDSTREAKIAGTVEGSVRAPSALQPQVVLYATSWCPYCAKTRAFFKRHGIQYVERNIEHDPRANAEYQRLGGGGVPVIVVGNRVVDGYDERRLGALLGPWLR
jgi:glutaredoxin